MNKERGYFPESQGNSPRKQFEFNQENGAFEIPQNLGELYPDLARYLEGQKLWKDYLRKSQKSDRQALLIDFQKKIAFSFNPHNWQEKKELSPGDFPSEQTGSILFLCSSLGNQEREALETAGLFLAKDSPIFIFESFPQKEKINKEELAKERQGRKRILQNLGFAEGEILIRPSLKKEDRINNFLVWRARMPKEWHPKKPVNFLEEGPYWRRRWIQELLAKNKRDYENDGYRIISDEAIKAALRKTTFPPNTLSQAKLGLGYILEAACGCRWEISLNGDLTRLYQCEIGCEG